MATLPRPGVEIAQEIVVQAPTVLNPTLVPCLIGPCFQIVKPITGEGSLDPTAQVTVAAILESDDVLAEELSLSGKSMLINVNSKGAKAINFPVTIGGAAISHELTVNTLNKQLPSGAIAQIIGGKLRLSTTAAGPTQSLELLEVVDSLGVPDPTHSAYGPNNDIINMSHLQGKKTTGQSVYTNLSYTVPYTSFPSPMTSVGEVLITDSATIMYRYFDGILSEISEDSATNVNSYHQGNTKVADEWVGIGSQPALGNGQKKLWGKPTGSSANTNTLVHMGSDGRIEVPLGHALDPSSKIATNLPMWPDPEGNNKLVIEAVGLSKYWETGNPIDAAPSTVIGVDSNNITVQIKDAALAVTYNSPNLVISLKEDTKVSDLRTLLDANTSLWEDELTLTLDWVGDEDQLVLQFVNSAGTVITDLASSGVAYNLHGGSDPANFTENAADDVDTGQDHRESWVTGAVNVTAGNTGDQLGVGGQTLTLIVDGNVTNITIPTNTSVKDAIHTALDDASIGAADTVSVKNFFGETYSALQINTTSGDGHESTIEVGGDDAVITALFSGTSAGADTGVDAQDAGLWASNNGGAGDVARGALIEPTDYNTLATTQCQNAFVPGTLILTLSGMEIRSQVRLGPDIDLAAGTANQARVLALAIDGAHTNPTLDIPNSGDFANIQALADELNTQFAVKTIDADIQAAAMDTEILLWSPTNKTLQLHSNAAGAQGGFTTHTEVDAMFGGPTAAHWDLASARISGATVTVQDTDTNPQWGLQVTNVSDLTGIVNAPSTSNAALTKWFMGGDGDNEGAVESFVDYSGGTIRVIFSGDHEAANTEDALAVACATTNQSKAALSYTRFWPCATGPSSPQYTSRMFHGQSNETLAADMVRNDGTVLGRIVDINALNIQDKSFTGSALTYSEFAVKAATTVDSWYITAENLITGDVDNPRVEPEATGDDLAQKYLIKPALLRDKAGICRAGVQAPVYVDYTALRKDVTADTANPGLLVFNSVSEVEALIGPISPSNPLAFALYLSFLNTTNINVSALGVAQITADAPNGTLEAYAEALEYLQLKEVYALAPLTDDMEVFKKIQQHCTDMSEPLGKKERMCITCPSLPTEKNPTLVASAELKITDIGGGKYELEIADEAMQAQLNLPMSLNGKLDANGNTIGAANGSQFTPDAGIYIDRAGDAYRYLVIATPSSAKVVIDTNPGFLPGFGPGTGGNDDSYIRTGTDAIANLETFEADGELCTLYVRQAGIDMSTTAGKLSACETLAEIAGGVTGFQNRRMVIIQPEQVGVTSQGLEIVVPGYYLACGIAAMIGQQNPSQPFTNLPMIGYTQPVGSSDKFSENQMATAAAGGIYWVIQDVPGAPLVSRHQLTTDVSSLKTRELSILKAVDYVAKLIRNQVKRFIGRNNITKQLLEAISLGISAALASVTGSVVAEATLDKLQVDKSSPDTILAEISIVPFYPANRIKITIFI